MYLLGRLRGFNRFIPALAVLATAGLGIASQAMAQATDTAQTLDRADVFSTTKAQGLTPTPVPYAVTALTGFTECQNTSTRGMFCLDGNVVRNWPDPEKTPETATTLLRCDDPAFALDKGAICTALTVDLSGNIWLAGKKSNAYSLMKIVKAPCPSVPAGETAYTQLTNATAYCFRTYAAGRPLLTDLSPVDGDTGNNFQYGPGILGVENGNTATFFSKTFGSAPVLLAAGKSVWGLSGNEQLMGMTVLQRTGTIAPPDPAAGTYTDSFVVGTTSTGRVLAKQIAPTATTVFNTNFLATTGRGTACPGVLPAAKFMVRASVKSGQVFLTDKSYCRAVVTLPNYLYSFPADPTGQAFSLNTVATVTTGAQPPEGLSVAAGIDVDLKTCGQTQASCTLIPDGTSDGAQTIPGALLAGVTLDPGASGMALFQIKNIPDCRYITPKPAACTNALDPAVINMDGSPVTPTSPPEKQFLNIRPLLPPEILELYPPNSLPRLLVSPRYRAIGARDNRFDALYGVTDPSVQFRETFTAQFDVSDLLGGGGLGCGIGGVQPNVNWDVIVTISEKYTTVGGPADVSTPQNVDMLINSSRGQGCFNPTSGSGLRWSIYAYGLQMAQEIVGSVPAYPDSIFAHLLASLGTDLGNTIAQYACVNADGGTAAPLSTNACTTLQGAWSDAAVKLSRCITAATSPKQSGGAQNCRSFETQFLTFKNTLATIPRQGSDPANRIGEVKARTEVLEHVYTDHFTPSIPTGGFINP